MIKIENQKENYRFLFNDYPVFHLFLEYAFDYTPYEIYINDLNHPTMGVLHVPPAYLFAGMPDDHEKDQIRDVLPNGAWIVSPSRDYDQWLTQIYGSSIQSYPRVLFDESSLDIEDLKKHIHPLPEELSIVPIEEKHLLKGMIKEEILDRFFFNTSFLTCGFGLALVNREGIVHGFALTNYPIGHSKDIEVSYRVGYDSYTKYRKQGIGTTLVSHFLIDAINRGYHPIWDAANPISVHIAKKLGYVEKTHWMMFRIMQNQPEN